MIFRRCGDAVHYLLLLKEERKLMLWWRNSDDMFFLLDYPTDELKKILWAPFHWIGEWKGYHWYACCSR
ncbi:MAG TPA: hypothetical protein DCS30_05130 [Rhizobiales bacterium]|nr:hypothetical protein [Hyphomicrobiales bacterium]